MLQEGVGAVGERGIGDRRRGHEPYYGGRPPSDRTHDLSRLFGIYFGPCAYFFLLSAAVAVFTIAGLAQDQAEYSTWMKIGASHYSCHSHGRR